MYYKFIVTDNVIKIKIQLRIGRGLQDLKTKDRNKDSKILPKCNLYIHMYIYTHIEDMEKERYE